MRWSTVCALVASGGCQQIFGLEAPVAVDGAPDIAVDGGPTCLGEGAFEVCSPGTLSPLELRSFIDTSGDAACTFIDPDHPTWCVIAGHDIIITDELRAVGSRPLVVFALASLVIEAGARVDVSSSRSLGPTGTASGAAADSVLCAPGAPADGDSSGGGGGHGGSFGSIGGSGGRGDSDSILGGFPAAADPTVPTTLRGGCPGGEGGMAGGAAAAPGSGGGVVYLVAGQTLQIDGVVNASGAGGAGGTTPKGGGAGGGSGGMIALWAPSITVTGELYANGGGGAGGADTGAGGKDGAESTSFAAPAPGGLGGGFLGTCGFGPGCGGDGAALGYPARAGEDDATGAGGGGGGGGLGVILVVSGQEITGNLSPAAVRQ